MPAPGVCTPFIRPRAIVIRLVIDGIDAGFARIWDGNCCRLTKTGQT